MLEQIRSWGQHWRQKRVAALLLNRISWTRNWKVCSSDARDDLQWGFIKWWAKANNFLCPLLQKKIQVNELVSIFDFLPFPKLIRWSPQIWNLSCIDMILCRETNWNRRNPRGSSPDHPWCLSRGFSGQLWARLLLLPRMLLSATPGAYISRILVH